MDTISFCFLSFLLSSSLLHSSLSAFSAELPRSEREALQIIIIGGGGYRPPSKCPPPPPPLLTRLEKARRVLLQFKETVGDNNFTANWQGTDPCMFQGVKCDMYPIGNETAVSGLDFNQVGFSGLGGSELNLSIVLGIPELTFFHVNSNNFTGALPQGIQNYQYFFELDLSNNKIQGNFPRDVLSYKQLIFLDLRFNSLTGLLPPELFSPLQLDVIFVNNNQFSGSLPENFGSTPARYLTFARNKFSGPIPSSIGKAANLTEVLFLGNQFSGCLPYEIGYLKKAVVFDVSENLLTGPIPCSFACLQSIRFLNLAKNKFYGPVPESVCELPGIRNNGNLSLAGNYFTEIGPECEKLIKPGVLDVNQNCIKGLPNQRSPEECWKFFHSVKPCPNERSLYVVPCKKHYYSTNEETTASPPAPVTYEALKPKPHRLL